MSLNDEQEKLKQAEYWLRATPATSEHHEASLNHIIWAAQHSEDPAFRKEARDILVGLGYTSWAVVSELSRRGCPLCPGVACGVRRARADCPGPVQPVSWSRG